LYNIPPTQLNHSFPAKRDALYANNTNGNDAA